MGRQRRRAAPFSVTGAVTRLCHCRPVAAAPSTEKCSALWGALHSESSQIDWGQARVWLGAQRQVRHIFVLTLGYSRRSFYVPCLSETLAELLDAHEQAFTHFDGRTQEHLYDRPRTVCAYHGTCYSEVAGYSAALRGRARSQSAPPSLRWSSSPGASVASVTCGATGNRNSNRLGERLVTRRVFRCARRRAWSSVRNPPTAEKSPCYQRDSLATGARP